MKRTDVVFQLTPDTTTTTRYHNNNNNKTILFIYVCW